jgi:S1-C subfamily serine protease
LVRDGTGFKLDLQEIKQGTGSGFVWDGQHVVTNYHVIENADRATVVLSDHTTREATLVGADSDSDIAVLRVQQQADATEARQRPLEPLERGNSHNLHVGQRVFAIGNPFGLDQTLTSGIVSGLGREMRGVSGRPIRGLVQTDAAINPGNSGGPLLNARGQLIGVNTMIASPSGAFAGVGFAIPVDTVLRVVKEILVYGHCRRAYLGVQAAPGHVARNFSALLRAQGQDELTGVVVLYVEPGSPAEAGLRPTRQMARQIDLGDVIVAVGGARITTAEELADAMAQRSVGDAVELAVRRWDKELKVQIRLDERPGRHSSNGS